MFIKSNMENNYNYNYTHISLVWSIMWAIMDLESRKSFPHTKHLYRLSIQSLHCLVTVSALSYCLPQTVHSNGFFMPKCSLTMCTARLFAFAKHFWHCLHLCLPRLMVLCSWRVLGHAEALTPADYTHTHTQYTTILRLCRLSGTTRVSWYQKVHFAIFWIFWSKMKIT